MILVKNINKSKNESDFATSTTKLPIDTQKLYINSIQAILAIVLKLISDQVVSNEMNEKIFFI